MFPYIWSVQTLAKRKMCIRDSIMIYPLLWMISATFKDNSEIFAGIGLWIKNPTLEGYKNALNNFGRSEEHTSELQSHYSISYSHTSSSSCWLVRSCSSAFRTSGKIGMARLPAAVRCV